MTVYVFGNSGVTATLANVSTITSGTGDDAITITAPRPAPESISAPVTTV